MSRGPLIAVGALAAVAGAAALVVLSSSGPQLDLDDGALTPGGPGPTAATVVPPVTRDTTTAPLPLATMKRPDNPNPAGPVEGPKGPGSKLSAKRGTKRQSKNQRVGRLLDSLEQAVAASDGSAIEDMIAKLLAMGDEALPDLIDALQRADITQRNLRSAIVDALAKIPQPAAARALQQLALDGTDDRELRKIAALASLGRIGGEDAFAVVRDAAEFEEDEAVRRQAVAALGSKSFFGQPGQVELLLKKVRTDADEGVRRWAMSSLGSSRDPRAREELAGLMREWPDSSTRVTLYHSLQMRKDRAVEGVLAEALARETDAVMVKRATGALMNVLGKDARKYVERSRDRFQSRQDLKVYFDSLLRALDNPNSHGHGGVKPPGAPK